MSATSQYVVKRFIVPEEKRPQPSCSQLGLHAGQGIPPGTVSSRIPHPEKCPQGSIHLCGAGMAIYQVSGPKKKYNCC